MLPPLIWYGSASATSRLHLKRYTSRRGPCSRGMQRSNCTRRRYMKNTHTHTHTQKKKVRRVQPNTHTSHHHRRHHRQRKTYPHNNRASPSHAAIRLTGKPLPCSRAPRVPRPRAGWPHSSPPRSWSPFFADQTPRSRLARCCRSGRPPGRACCHRHRPTRTFLNTTMIPVPSMPPVKRPRSTSRTPPAPRRGNTPGGSRSARPSSWPRGCG